jgi:hypothetical protein
MLYRDLLDRRDALAIRQRLMHVAESLAPRESDRREAEHVYEGAVQRSTSHIERAAEFGNVDGPVACLNQVALDVSHQRRV